MILFVVPVIHVAHIDLILYRRSSQVISSSEIMQVIPGNIARLLITEDNAARLLLSEKTLTLLCKNVIYPMQKRHS